MNPDLINYIRQYRNTYTREAIDGQLVAAGYRPEDVQAAWAVVESGADPGAPGASWPQPPAYRGWGTESEYVPPHKRLVSYPAFWLTTFGFIILAYGVPVLFLVGITSINHDPNAFQLAQTLTLLGFGATQLGAVIGAVMLRERNEPVSRGLLVGLLVADIVLPLIVFGACLVLLTGVGLR